MNGHAIDCDNDQTYALMALFERKAFRFWNTLPNKSMVDAAIVFVMAIIAFSAICFGITDQVLGVEQDRTNVTAITNTVPLRWSPELARTPGFRQLTELTSFRNHRCITSKSFRTNSACRPTPAFSNTCFSVQRTVCGDNPARSL
ncbi:MAG: hypothetical protein U1F68_01970 [Gammaproteobacteria bacterium]